MSMKALAEWPVYAKLTPEARDALIAAIGKSGDQAKQAEVIAALKKTASVEESLTVFIAHRVEFRDFLRAYKNKAAAKPAVAEEKPGPTADERGETREVDLGQVQKVKVLPVAVPTSPPPDPESTGDDEGGRPEAEVIPAGSIPTKTIKGAQKPKGSSPLSFLTGIFSGKDKKADPRKPAATTSRPGDKKGKSAPMNKGLLIGGVVLVIIVAVVILLSVSGGGGGGYQPSPEYPLVTETDNPGSQGTNTEEFWADLGQTQPDQRSPGALGYMTALTGFGIFLRLMLTMFAMLDVKVRLKTQPGAFFFMLAGLAAGWLTLPIFNLIASSTSIGVQMLLFTLLGVLWGVTVIAIFAEKDRTAISAALALFGAALFYEGAFKALPVLGGFFGQQWPMWSGIYSVGGVLTLIWSGRTVHAALTLFVIALGIISIITAAQEVGKKKGMRASIMTGVIVVGVFILTNYLLGLGVSALLARQVSPSVEVKLVFEVLRPLLAWVLSFVISMVIGMLMGDIEVGFAENKGQSGMSGGSFSFQNIADFAFLATVVPLYLGVIITIV